MLYESARLTWCARSVDLLPKELNRVDNFCECHGRHSIKEGLEVWKGAAKEVKTRESNSASR